MTASLVYAPPTVVATPHWDELERRLRAYSPKSEMGLLVKKVFHYLPPELAGEMLDTITRVVILESALRCRIYRSNQSEHGPEGWARLEDYGLGGLGITSRKVVTDAGVAFLVDVWQNTFEMEIMKYHGLGTGSTAEAVGNTALVTELTTQYNNSGDLRATGTLTETSAPVFATVGVNLLDTGATIAEHGLFTSATPAAGTLWDRSLTGNQVLSAGDSLSTTYSLTVSSGG